MKITLDVKAPYDKGFMVLDFAAGNKKGGVDLIDTQIDLNKIKCDLNLNVDNENGITNADGDSEADEAAAKLMELIVKGIEEELKKHFEDE